MVKVRIIPTLLWKDLGLVKGVGFNSWRRIGSLLPAIKVFNARDVDELILNDIAASVSGQPPDFDTLEGVSNESYVPFTVGGGIQSVDDITKILRYGADKVSINSSAYTSPRIIEESAKKFGSQCVVASVDVKRSPEGYFCYSHSGTKNTGQKVIDWVKELEARGAGEILLTSIDRDGTMEGYDLELISLVTSNVKIPVIASGGAGNYQDMVDAILIGKASAVAAASIFQFTDQTPTEAKKYLHKAGVSVRKNFEIGNF
ncbi:imidazole glycerol phosphate synthase subunit HisF [Leptospira kanakyensis]|uniref:imidazole glycerol-phosphate synthase n=1 Tax=Leptospira kanakyensis TaxID=2484968 RepID=A0A6N4QEI5_9LEPT|nr:imidazole glycerol phosphate synthase cyclase subunit [Leptospira kanakyensis]TGK51935.1 imidazole glycerol phosphate synthase subunit HisF [Leptospira kanakyensis]TGK57157.1 imidazole glycerol phosphate synthase subunit HisF [Leptospira kanakyensis]TGK71827.1 imidazole glycerol phosphate synthase subunit HisF [Leptospira kanakyensis]